MSFKRQFLIKLVGIALFTVLLNPVSAALTPDEIRFIKNQPLVPQLEETLYDGPSINSETSYREDHYKTTEMLELGIRLRKRIQLSIDYRNRGDIGQFNEILIDIVTQHYFSEESAWAAILLGDFEVLLYNLDEALKYYIYGANIHYASEFGLSARLKLGILLDGMGHFSKAEEVITDIINNEDRDNPITMRARDYMKSRYTEKARWYLNSGDIANAEKYFRFYKFYEDTSTLDTIDTLDTTE